MKVETLLNRRNNNFDLIRIVLASMVIMSHTDALNGSSKFWVDIVAYFTRFTDAGSLAVKLFFFISGLVVTNSLLIKNSAFHFLASRFFRLVPALFFVLLITVFIFGPFVSKLSPADYFGRAENLLYIGNNLIFVTSYHLPGVFSHNLFKYVVNGSLWSLSYEVKCYLVLLITYFLLHRAKKVFWNIIFFIILIDAFLPQTVLFHFLGEAPQVKLLPASFAFGVFCAINASRIKVSLAKVIVAFTLFVLLRTQYYAHSIFVFASCIAVLFLASNKYVLKFKPKHDISYGIYLWGFLIQQTIFHIFGHMYAGIHCLLALGISSGLALITHLYIERPFIDLGKRVLKLPFASNAFPKYLSKELL